MFDSIKTFIMNFRIPLLIIFINVTTLCNASTIDSLKIAADKTKGRERIDILNKIANNYRLINQDSTLKYSDIAVKESLNHPYIVGALEGMQIKGIALMYKFRLEEAEEVILSSIDLAQSEGYMRDIYKSYNILGLIQYRQSREDEALDSYKKSIELADKLNDSLYMAYVYNNIGLLSLRRYQYNEALINFRKTIDLLRATGNAHRTSSPLNNIGLIHNRSEEYRLAIKYYTEALEVFTFGNNKIGIVQTQINIGNAYHKLTVLDSAKNYYTDALNISRDINNEQLECRALFALSQLYHLEKDYVVAKQYLDEALVIGETLNLKDILPPAYVTMSDIEFQFGNIKRALEYNAKGEELAKLYNDLETQKTAASNFSVMYESMGSIHKALEYYKINFALHDSIMSENNKRDIAEIEAKYSLKEKSRENRILKSENELKGLEVRYQRHALYYLLGFFVVTIIFILVLYNRFRIKRRSNIELAKMNELIKVQNEKLELSNATKDKFFSIIAHDLKNPFGSILAMTDLLAIRYKGLTSDVVYKMIVELNNASRNTYNLLENLLSWARSQKGEIKVVQERLNVYNLIEESMLPYVANAAKKNISIVNNVDTDIYAHIDKNTMKTVFSNLINNAIKFTEIDGVVEMFCECMNNTVTVSVKDNGIGMTKDVIDSIFRIDKNQSTKGTNEEMGTGLGLILCKEFSDKNNVNISVESTVGEGSRFILVMQKAENE